MERVAATIDTLYAAAHGATEWSGALEQVRLLLNASGVCVGDARPEPSTHAILSTSADPAFLDSYFRDFSGTNPLWQGAAQLAPGSLYQDDMPTPRRTLRRSPFWNEWMAPQDYHQTLGCHLATEGVTTWLFDIERGRRQAAFDPDDIELFRILSRTMAKAMTLRDRTRNIDLSHAYAARAANDLTLGMMFVDPSGRIRYANRAADALIGARADIFQRTGDNVFLYDTRSARDYRALLAQACDPVLRDSGFLWLRSATREDAPVFAYIGPFTGEDAAPRHREALVLLRTAEANTPVWRRSHLAMIFALTDAEARVAALLTQGRQAMDVATELGLRITTVRTHISNILAKSGTRHQSEFFLLLGRLSVPAPNCEADPP